MGGDAFPDTRRLSEDDYTAVCANISNILNSVDNVDNVLHGFPVEVKDKAQLCKEKGMDKPYGDVDVIVAIEEGGNSREVAQKVRDELGGEDKIVKSDTTYSFLTKERFQVDLLFCDVSDLKFLLAYKANNDFGALIGHLLTPFHLKWSTKGLALRLRVEEVSGVGTTKEDLLLSSDMKLVCQFLGLDPTCLDGVTRMDSDDIFQRLTECKVYYKEEYNEKYKLKQRAKKRPVSGRFFELLESSSDELERRKEEKFRGDPVHDALVGFRRNQITKDEYHRKIAAYFDRLSDLEALHEKMSQNKRKCTNSKFDYDVLVTWYPDQHRNFLGKVMGKVKSKHSGNGTEGFIEWVNNTDLEVIKEEVDQLIKKCLDQKLR